jgi:aspartyl-tRNA(Asn)/glutamyl-tRNA(Gln) amidotransferase subunit C
MALDKKTVQNLMQLSRIRCTEEEQEALLRDLKGVLGYMEQLQKINTDNVAPCNHVLDDVVNVIREDVIGNILPRAEFLANAPSQIGGMIRVPSVRNNTKS